MGEERSVEERATEWLRSYHGSIDSRALILAFTAGHRDGVAMIRQGEVRELAEALSGLRAMVGAADVTCDEVDAYLAAVEKADALLARYDTGEGDGIPAAVTERGVPGESREPATEDAETGASSDG